MAMACTTTSKRKRSVLSVLQDPSCGIPFDITFMIVNNDNVEEEGKIEGHKVILAAFSSVFKGMFFGPVKISEDVVKVKETTVKAFEIMVKFIYQAKINFKDMDLLELYDIVNLAEMYDIPELVDELKTQMENLTLRLDSLVNVAHIALQFHQFEDVSFTLLNACAMFLQKTAQKSSDRIQFAVDHLGGGRERTALKLLALVEDLPPLQCKNCRRNHDNCLDGEPVIRHHMINAGLHIMAIRNLDCVFVDQDYDEGELPANNVVTVLGVQDNLIVRVMDSNKNLLETKICDENFEPLYS